MIKKKFKLYYGAIWNPLDVGSNKNKQKKVVLFFCGTLNHKSLGVCG